MINGQLKIYSRMAVYEEIDNAFQIPSYSAVPERRNAFNILVDVFSLSLRTIAQ